MQVQLALVWKENTARFSWEEHQSLTTLTKNSAWEHEMKECTRSAECVCRDMAGDHSQRDDVLPDRLRLQFWLPSWLQCHQIAILPPYNLSYCRGSARERWQGRRRTPRRRWTLASLLLLLDFVKILNYQMKLHYKQCVAIYCHKFPHNLIARYCRKNHSAVLRSLKLRKLASLRWAHLYLIQKQVML